MSEPVGIPLGAPYARGAAAARTDSLALHRVVFWMLCAAKLVTGWGVQWDIQWHVRIGRDTFWIAPHLMTYAGVTLAGLLSFGMLALDTLRGGAPVARLRVAGLEGTRGFHLAAWGMALTVLAAPIDDLWHRLFGLDVTLWSPPHLLGIAGGVVNSWGVSSSRASSTPTAPRASSASRWPARASSADCTSPWSRRASSPTCTAACDSSPSPSFPR